MALFPKASWKAGYTPVQSRARQCACSKAAWSGKCGTTGQCLLPIHCPATLLCVSPGKGKHSPLENMPQCFIDCPKFTFSNVTNPKLHKILGHILESQWGWTKIMKWELPYIYFFFFFFILFTLWCCFMQVCFTGFLGHLRGKKIIKKKRYWRTEIKYWATSSEDMSHLDPDDSKKRQKTECSAVPYSTHWRLGWKLRLCHVKSCSGTIKTCSQSALSAHTQRVTSICCPSLTDSLGEPMEALLYHKMCGGVVSSLKLSKCR